MNRRAMMGRVVALAGVAAVAPAALTAEAASEAPFLEVDGLHVEAADGGALIVAGSSSDLGYVSGHTLIIESGVTPVTTFIPDEARYQAKMGGALARALDDEWSWAKALPLTFEAMQADCAAHGCSLDFKHANGGPATHVLTHVQRCVDGECRWDGFDYRGQGTDQWLADVDAWRRSLHDG